MSDLDQKNSKKQGDVGLGVAVGYFAKRGATVSLPLTDSQSYDLIVDVCGEGLSRVQVKTTRSKSAYGIFLVTLVTKGGNRSGAGKDKLFDNTQVDHVFIYTSDGEQYLIPSKQIAARRQLSLGKEYTIYKVV